MTTRSLLVVLLCVIATGIYAQPRHSYLSFHALISAPKFIGSPAELIAVEPVRMNSDKTGIAVYADDQTYPRKNMRLYNEGRIKKEIKTSEWFFLSAFVTKLLLLL